MKRESLPLTLDALGTSDRVADDARTRAFTCVYDAHFDRVYAFLLYRLDNPALAEDLAAEVFVRAWERLGDFRQSGAVAAWLFVTARHLVSDYYRGKRVNLPLEELSEERHPTTGSPEGDMLAREQAALVRRCLSQLSEREQEIVGLRFIGELRNRDVARIVGTSEGNVAKILHRTLRKLREQLRIQEARDVVKEGSDVQEENASNRCSVRRSPRSDAPQGRSA